MYPAAATCAPNGIPHSPVYSNAVYEFKSSCDMNSTYNSMSTRHVATRVREHLNLGNFSQNSAIKDHIRSCDQCSNIKYDEKCFRIIKKCNSEFDTKIHEALMIKKRKPTLNKQLFRNGASFLLNVF